jgi:hypothetical protein
MVVMPALVAGIHVSISNQKDVDGRVKPGHDEIQSEIGSALIPGYRFAHPGLHVTHHSGSIAMARRLSPR